MTGEKGCCPVNLLQLVFYTQIKIVSRLWLIRSWFYWDHIWTCVLCGCFGVRKYPQMNSEMVQSPRITIIRFGIKFHVEKWKKLRVVDLKDNVVENENVSDFQMVFII